MHQRLGNWVAMGRVVTYYAWQPTHLVQELYAGTVGINSILYDLIVLEIIAVYAWYALYVICILYYALLFPLRYR